MSNNIDFNQDDFEKIYDDLHNSTSNNAIHELEKMRFKDEADKLIFTKSLEAKLNENYAILRDSKLNEFKQHLKVVSMLADSQFEAYKNNLNLNLDYENHTDFVSYINEKYLTVKNASINSFENSQQLVFTPRINQFKKELIAKMDIEYLTWKETTLKIYEEFLDLKRQIEIEKCLNFQLKRYQQVMNTEIDFNQDDFEKYYENLHQSAMSRAIQDFEKIKFKDEVSKKVSINYLEDKLTENYNILRATKLSEFNQYLKIISMMVDSQFEVYKNDINLNLDYENHTDFENYINRKHLAAKKSSIDGFENSQQLIIAPRKSEFKEKLISKIDSEYLAWKDANMRIYNKKQNQEIQKFSQLKLDVYKSTLDSDIDFNREGVLNVINNRHITVKEKLKQQFINETMYLNNTDAQTKLKSQLSIQIDNAFKAWFDSQKAKYEKFLKIRKSNDDLKLSSIHRKLLVNYKKNTEAICSFADSNFIHLVSTKHMRESSNAISKFRNETTGIYDRTSVEHEFTLLINAMEDINNKKIEKFRGELNKCIEIN